MLGKRSACNQALSLKMLFQFLVHPEFIYLGFEFESIMCTRTRHFGGKIAGCLSRAEVVYLRSVGSERA